MKLFVTCQRNGSDSFLSYEGQDEETVTRLLTDLGATAITFITEDAWIQVAEPPPPQDRRSEPRDPGESDQHAAEALGLVKP